ncbi:hypothetical protein GCM10020331_007510 [Ectobacillus funiculus]
MMAAFVLSSAIVGCSKQEEPQSSGKQEKSLKVVTTFLPYVRLYKNVVGSNGKVDVLVPAGTEPHDF